MNGVTVCVTYHNEPAEVISRALASVFVQTVQPLEVLVIDDGSNTPPKIGTHELMRIVSVTHRGLASARNTAVMQARGDAFLPLDSDDWFDPRYLELALPLLADADVVVPGLQEHGPPPRDREYAPGYDRRIEDVTLDVMWSYNRCYYASIYRTALLRSVGGWNPRMTEALEDYDLHVDLMTRGARYVGCYHTLFHYTTAADGMLMRAHRDGGHARMVAEMKRHHRRP